MTRSLIVGLGPWPWLSPASYCNLRGDWLWKWRGQTTFLSLVSILSLPGLLLHAGTSKRAGGGGNATVTRGLCAGYWYKLIEGIKSNQPEVKASKSDIRFQTYDHLKFCMISHWFCLCQWAVQAPTRCRADTYSQNFWHPCPICPSICILPPMGVSPPPPPRGVRPRVKPKKKTLKRVLINNFFV